MPDNYNVINAQGLSEALVDTPPLLLDVREASEFEAGYIAGAVNVPIRELLKNLDKLPGLDEPIVVYCASGHRGGLAMAALQLLGYTNVRNLGGGLGAWQKGGFPVETAAAPEVAAGAAPEVDATRLRDLDAFLTALPEGFFTVKAADLNVELGGSPAPFILDVRSAEEFAGGYIEGATNIALRDLPANLASLPADKAAPIVVLCASGHRGSIGMMYLRMTGYSEVRNLGGGMNAWIAAELPVVK
jgi:rhodanese-related sulfurtransferase